MLTTMGAAKKRSGAKQRPASGARRAGGEAPPSVAGRVALAWARVEAGRSAGRLRPRRVAEALNLDVCSDCEIALPTAYWAFVGRHDGERPGEQQGVVPGFRLLAHEEGQSIDMPGFYADESTLAADLAAAIVAARAPERRSRGGRRPRPDPRIRPGTGLEWTIAVGADGARIVLNLADDDDGETMTQVLRYDADGRVTFVAESLLEWMEGLPTG